MSVPPSDNFTSIATTLLYQGGVQSAFIAGTNCPVIDRSGNITTGNCGLSLPTLCEKNLWVASEFDLLSNCHRIVNN